MCQTTNPTRQPSPFHSPTKAEAVLNTQPPNQAAFIDDSTSEHHQRDRTFAGRHVCVLLRKEVIQPHLPVRLPCYDFVPIASPTFDGSLHKGWATGFGCCRLS